MKHYSVLLKESLELLDIKEDGIYVDGTLGRAGHSSALLKRIPNGHLYAFDKDNVALEESKDILDKIGSNFTLLHDGFENIKEVLASQGIQSIDGLLLDIGVSSPQFDDASRGFSYREDARLDMRMDKTNELSAYEVVNDYSYEQLCSIMFRYGEEKYAKQIARKIEKQRQEKAIETTFELVDVIKRALPSKVVNAKGHPAKKVFQAIRIEVNNELGALEKVLEDGLMMLKPKGRLVVITFHSLEDRLVKTCFQKHTKVEKVNKRLPMLETQEKDFELVTRKVLVASQLELNENRRSHSAKLRAIRKIR